MTDMPVSSEPQRRPFGVLVVAAIQIIRAALLVGQLFGLGTSIEWLKTSAQIPDPPSGTPEFVISRGLGIALIVASVVIGLGLLAGRRWGWVGAIILAGLALAFAIGAWWDGRPTYLSMLINVIAVFYLNQREVRATFEERTLSSQTTQARVIPS
jgi:hypothetical protein